MNFRSMVLGGAFALAAAAAAKVTVPESNVFGWMRIDSMKKYTVVAVPWLACEGGAVKVADLVKTDTLAVGDKLYVYNGTDKTYSVWSIVKDAEGKMSWQGASNVSESGVTTAAGAAEATLARGSALWLYRKNPGAPFYVYGKYEAGAVTAPALTANAMNLIANPNAKPFNVNGASSNADEVGTKVTGQNGDQIAIPGDNGFLQIYTYDANDNGGKWSYNKKSTTTVGGRTVTQVVKSYDCTIEPGQGAWYVSTGETVPTINWVAGSSN